MKFPIKYFLDIKGLYQEPTCFRDIIDFLDDSSAKYKVGLTQKKLSGFCSYDISRSEVKENIAHLLGESRANFSLRAIGFKIEIKRMIKEDFLLFGLLFKDYLIDYSEVLKYN